jgi:hypothetical protein
MAKVPDYKPISMERAMSLWSLFASRRSGLINAVVVAGLAGAAGYRMMRAAQRKKKPAPTTLQTWEGEGGNIVPPQPSDAAIPELPKATTAADAAPSEPSLENRASIQ